MCRLCDKNNGCDEYKFDTGYDYKLYVWPSGLSHYYTEHGVHPPQDFYQAIMRYRNDTRSQQRRAKKNRSKEMSRNRDKKLAK